MRPGNDFELLRLSLVFVWLCTAVVSVWELHGQSAQLLAPAGIANPRVAEAVILGGTAVDAVLGLMLWLRPSRRIYLVALAMMVAMTSIATLVAPGWLLHPFGPLARTFRSPRRSGFWHGEVHDAVPRHQVVAHPVERGARRHGVRLRVLHVLCQSQRQPSGAGRGHAARGAG